MPPKKKGKAKKGPMLIDGVDTSAMTRDQLEQFALRLKAEMDREREERNYFQMERDKIRMFWEITRGQMEELRTDLRQKDHEVEMAQEVADIDTKQIMQQMKHLQYENHYKIGEIRAEAMTQLQLSQEEHIIQEIELLKDKRELRRLLREAEELFKMQIEQLKDNHKADICEIRIECDNEVRDVELLQEQKMHQLKTDMELSYRMEMFEVEERKNTQIQRLINSHEEAFEDMKNYYNDITLNNLGLISSLKEQMEVLRKQAERSDRIASETLAENRRIREPLDQATSELIELRRKLEHYDRDRNQLTRLKSRNNFIEKQLKSFTWETEALLLRNDTLMKEREEMKVKFEDVVTEVQQKTGFQNVLLERKVAFMTRQQEAQEAVLTETIESCTDKSKMLQPIEGKRMKDLLDEKNKQIDDLQFEVARVTKSHDDMIATYESKLSQYGIPAEELGFKPLWLTSKYNYLNGPAGLVTENK